MDLEMKARRSLPPLVEGKIHGYLTLVIDEVIWSKRSPGEIKVLASWWGETDSAQFRPADITKSDNRPEYDISVIYAIRTNINLFQEYIKNCETIELVIVSEKTDVIIGTSQVTDLSDIFGFTPCFKYFPILNDIGHKIGEIHVSIKLTHVARASNMQFKTYKYQKKDNDVFSLTEGNIKYHQGNSVRDQKDMINNKIVASRKSFAEQNDTYKPLSKCQRITLQEPFKKFNSEVTDKLVAQVVARAQRLRGAILKEAYNEDPLALSDSSFSDGQHSYPSAEDEAKLYEYFVGKEMSSSDEHKALSTLRSTSPTSSLIEFASKSITSCKCDSSQAVANKMSPISVKNLSMEAPVKEKPCNNSKESLLLNHVDCIRILIESFSLSSAGYRRVKSTSLTRNDGRPLSVTYFVQYDTTFGYPKQTSERVTKESRPLRISSKKQIDQVIYFNHDGTYGISKIKVHTDYPIKFKVLVRHLNQKSPVELGTGSMSISEIIKSENLSTTQRLAIVNKGIKIGDLNITAELGSDFTHFGKQYVDGIMSTKENIPVLEMHPLPSVESNKVRCVTGTQSKTSSHVSSSTTKGVECLTSGNSSNLFTTKDMTQHRKDNDDKKIQVKNRENNTNNKILLHGLIYVAEGRELPELNTYLICRAFWKEDKTTSQICNNTRNPVYNFSQLVPLIHGADLLDRIKDNYIIIEVYCRNNDADNLLGLVKLPVHQLYVAYRDPLVLPHLLLSKYPVISVDGWVPIINPMIGQTYGQLLALVALGTAEQIALLQISRGLQTVSPTSYTISGYTQNTASSTNPLQISGESPNNLKELRQPQEVYSQNNCYAFRSDNTTEREYQFATVKTQESQTDFTTATEYNPEQLVLHNLVDRLAQVLATNKTNTDQAAQTEAYSEETTGTSKEPPLRLNELAFNHTSDDSDSSSLRNNFQLPTEMYRSVGVGAEYDEQLDQQPNITYSNSGFDPPPVSQNAEKEHSDSDCNDNTFRAVIEIECALHLPMVERANESMEPSTYVSFQANKSNSLNRLNSYTVTTVYLHSCNPKWNWKCDTKLPTELLLNDEKRLILKVWRILDPESSTQINLERDIVIGFSAIDLSVLMTGFPMVSGWFHIMDFTGKCNGQIKVNITPLENLSLLGKSVSTLNTTRVAACNVSQSSWSPMYSPEIHCNDTEANNTHFVTSPPKEGKWMPDENVVNDSVSQFTYGFEDVSMSFLSQSLKQTLTELDEITKRLESRLRDVTNTAFEDDSDNEFDLNEANSDNENTERHRGTVDRLANAQNISKAPQVSPMDYKFLPDQNAVEIENEQCKNRREAENCQSIHENHVTSNGISSKNLNPYLSSTSSNSYGPISHQDERALRNDILLNNITDHPARGTRTHINHLLDKLCFQPPVQSFSNSSMPMKKNIMDLLKNLHQNNNSIHDHGKCSREVKQCTIPTQTDDETGQNYQDFHMQSRNDSVLESNSTHYDKQVSSTVARPQNSSRISTVIREELIAEDNSDTSKCDELSTYLMASNVRHMDLDNIFNPLLYQHLVPDTHISNTVSPDGEAIEQLDNRYVRTFSTSINDKLNKDQNASDTGIACANKNSSRDRLHGSGLEHDENADLFRMTPSGISENVDGNIDLTVVRKPSYNDLMANNSTESTTTISPEQSSMKQLQLEMTDTSCSSSFDASVPVLSRQAPDGGNPMEDIAKPLITQPQDDFQDSSLSS